MFSPTIRPTLSLSRQIRSLHTSPVSLQTDLAIQQLIASANSTAQQLQSEHSIENHAGASAAAAAAAAAHHRPRPAVSIQRQAGAELKHDLLMARSRQARENRMVALPLPIAPGVKKDVPGVLSRARKRRPRRGSKESAASIAADYIPKQARLKREDCVEQGSALESGNSGRLSARGIRIAKIKPLRKMKISRLRRSLGRVLFSPGVQPLRDVRTGVWNFDPSLHDIPTPEEFAFERCPQYITPSQDSELLQLAQTHQCRFLGSTSTLTKALSQIYFAISGGKGVDLATLSQDFTSERTSFTPGAELPANLIINKMGGDHYSVDSDKSLDVENVISDFGRILEKMLTAEPRDFQRFLRSSPDDAVSEEERNEKEAYQYQRAGSLLMRSQLDCYDPRLPGSGVFDIKTRACLPVRYDRANYLANSAYDIWKERGYTQSFEREYYDLLRAGMLKFSLQVRIGAMDGIFLAYHNTSRIYGFQYIPLSEIDQRIFGSTELADQAFKLSVAILEKMLQRCVDAFPGESVTVTMKRASSAKEHSFIAYVEPKEWDEAAGKPPIQAITFKMKNFLDKEPVEGPIMLSIDDKVRRAQDWSIEYTITESSMDEEAQAKTRLGQQRLRKELVAMNSLYVPDGQSVESMRDRDRAVVDTQPVATIRWVKPGPRQLQLRKEAKESGQAYEKRKRTWKKGKIMSTA